MVSLFSRQGEENRTGGQIRLMICNTFIEWINYTLSRGDDNTELSNSIYSEFQNVNLFLVYWHHNKDTRSGPSRDPSPRPATRERRRADPASSCCSDQTSNRIRNYPAQNRKYLLGPKHECLVGEISPDDVEQRKYEAELPVLLEEDEGRPLACGKTYTIG